MFAVRPNRTRVLCLPNLQPTTTSAMPPSVFLLHRSLTSIGLLVRHRSTRQLRATSTCRPEPLVWTTASLPKRLSMELLQEIGPPRHLSHTSHPPPHPLQRELGTFPLKLVPPKGKHRSKSATTLSFLLSAMLFVTTATSRLRKSANHQLFAPLAPPSTPTSVLATTVWPQTATPPNPPSKITWILNSSLSSASVMLSRRSLRYRARPWSRIPRKESRRAWW
jgi:hypothetical protein